MLKKKALRKGLSDYQSEFCISVPTRIVLSGSVGSGDSNSRFLSYATIEKMKLRLLNSKFRKSCVPFGSFASVKSLYWATWCSAAALTISGSSATLAVSRLAEWPWGETVGGLQIIRDNTPGGFSVRGTLYGKANKKIADRAINCVQREKRRHFHLND